MKKICILFFLLPFFTNAQVITTIAGGDSSGYWGDGGPATAALLMDPICARADLAGNIYITDYAGCRIRKVSTSGIITTIAGNGTNAHTGDGTPATAAEVARPLGVAADAAGNIYFAEGGTGSVRKISTSGIITTVAGGGSSTAEGVPATAAVLSACDVAFDAAGNMYVADQAYARIREVNTAGIINTIAGTGSLGHSGDGGPATAAELTGPLAVAVDPAGNIYVVDNEYIRKINTSGTISTIGGTGSPGYGGDGGPATAATFTAPNGIAADAFGNVYIGDRGNNVVRKINNAGIVTTIAGMAPGGGFSGDGGPATAAQLAQPMGIGFDLLGNLYIADAANSSVRKVSGVYPVGVYNYTVTEHGCRMFPDPANSEINLVANEKINNIIINDLTGHEVFTHTYNSETVQVDISSLPTGVYLIKINGTEVRKFVKQ